MTELEQAVNELQNLIQKHKLELTVETYREVQDKLSYIDYLAEELIVEYVD